MRYRLLQAECSGFMVDLVLWPRLHQRERSRLPGRLDEVPAFRGIFSRHMADKIFLPREVRDAIFRTLVISYRL
jgi:hypothetical protein